MNHEANRNIICLTSWHLFPVNILPTEPWSRWKHHQFNIFALFSPWMIHQLNYKANLNHVNLRQRSSNWTIYETPRPASWLNPCCHFRSVNTLTVALARNIKPCRPGGQLYPWACSTPRKDNAFFTFVLHCSTKQTLSGKEKIVPFWQTFCLRLP